MDEWMHGWMDKRIDSWLEYDHCDVWRVVQLNISEDARVCTMCVAKLPAIESPMAVVITNSTSRSIADLLCIIRTGVYWR